MCRSRAHVPCFGGTWAPAVCAEWEGAPRDSGCCHTARKGNARRACVPRASQRQLGELEDSCLVRKVRGTAFRSLRLPCRRVHSISAASGWLVSHAMHGEGGRLHGPVWPGGLPLPSLSGGKPYTMWPSLPESQAPWGCWSLPFGEGASPIAPWRVGAGGWFALSVCLEFECPVPLLWPRPHSLNAPDAPGRGVGPSVTRKGARC